MDKETKARQSKMRHLTLIRSVNHGLKVLRCSFCGGSIESGNTYYHSQSPYCQECGWKIAGTQEHVMIKGDLDETDLRFKAMYDWRHRTL